MQTQALTYDAPNLTHRLRQVLSIFSALVFLLTVLFVFISLAQDTNRTHAWFYTLCLVQLFPAFVFLMTGKADFILFVMLSSFLQDTLNKMSAALSGSFSDSFLHALREQTICTAMTIAAFYFFSYLIFNYPNRNGLPRKLLFSPIPYSLLLIPGSIFLIFPDGIPASLSSLVNVATTASGILIFTSEVEDRPALVFVVRLLMVLEPIFVFLQAATVISIGSLAFVLFLKTVLERRFRNLWVVMLVGVMLLSLQGIKSQYREVVWYGTSTSFLEKVLLSANLMGTVWSSPEDEIESADSDNIIGADSESPDGGPPAEADDTLGVRTSTLMKTFGRFGDNSLERVLMMTPSTVPFWRGESYYSLLFIYIPRIIWPDKPSRNFWNKFGRLYGYLLEWDYMTSVGVGYYAEAYMNFGYPGLYAVALIFGLLVAGGQFFSYWVVRGNTAFLYIFILLPLISYSCDLGTILNNLVIEMVFLCLLRSRLIWLVGNPEPDPDPAPSFSAA